MTLTGALLQRVEHALVPLDVLRRALYRALVPWLGPWIRSRDVRVGLHAFSVIGGALLLALLVPWWLLALGPLLLGVPHLVADLRYLVAQPKLHERRGSWWIGGLLVLTGITVDLRLGLLAGLLAPLVLSRASLLRRLVVASPFAFLLGLGLFDPRPLLLGFAHLHNLVAVVLWLSLGLLLHGGGGVRLPPALLFLGTGAALLFGAFDTWLPAMSTPHWTAHVETLAPGMPTETAARWVVTFAFAQAVHYGLWLRVVPEEARSRPAPRSWKASFRALEDELGSRLLLGSLVLCIGFALWGAIDLVTARNGYFHLAFFHGPLELVALGLLLCEGPGFWSRD